MLFVSWETKMPKLQELHNCCSEQPVGPNCEIHPCTGAQGVWGDHHQQSERPQHLWNPSNPSHLGGFEGDLAKYWPNTWPEDSHLLQWASHSYPAQGRGQGEGVNPLTHTLSHSAVPQALGTERTAWMAPTHAGIHIPRAH